MKRWLLLLCLLMSPPLHAAYTVVEGVGMPAWSEHDGIKTALTPGLRLENSDIVTTGAGGRVSVKLGDETIIKLGENSKLVLDNLTPAQEANGVYRAAISVTQGEFRLSAKPLYKNAATESRSKNKNKKSKHKSKNREPLVNLRQHEFNVKLGALTAVSQSIDIIGKSSEERDLLVVLSGEAEVAHDDASTTTLNRARPYVDALNASGLNAPAKVAAQDLQNWKAETNLVTGRGLATRNGRWKVSVGTYQDRNEAEVQLEKLDEEGYAAEIVPTNLSGKAYVRLQMPHMKTRQDAAAVAERVRQQFDLDTVSIFR